MYSLDNFDKGCDVSINNTGIKTVFEKYVKHVENPKYYQKEKK